MRYRSMATVPWPWRESDKTDVLHDKRPVLALTSPPRNGGICGENNCISLYSLKHHDVVERLRVEGVDILDIHASRRLIVGVSCSQIHAWSSTTLQQLFVCQTVSPCTLNKTYSLRSSSQTAPDNVNDSEIDDLSYEEPRRELDQPDIFAPAVSVGERWIAFASNAVPNDHTNYSPSSVDAVKYKGEQNKCHPNGLTQPALQSDSMWAMASFGRTLGQRVIQRTYSAFKNARTSSAESLRECSETVNSSGFVMIRDVRDRKLIAHFTAHNSDHVGALKFDHSGLLLVSVSLHGTSIKIFRIAAWIANDNSTCPKANVDLIWKLSRGASSAYVRSISFSLDSSWIALATSHGTTHVFSLPNPIEDIIANPISSMDNVDRSKQEQKLISKSKTISSCFRISKQGLSNAWGARSLHSAASNLLRGTARGPLRGLAEPVAVNFVSFEDENRSEDVESNGKAFPSIAIANSDGFVRLWDLKPGCRNRGINTGDEPCVSINENEEALWKIAHQNSWDDDQSADADIIEFCLEKMNVSSNSTHYGKKIWAAAVEHQTTARTSKVFWSHRHY